jgi:Fe-S-cluster containining protein
MHGVPLVEQNGVKKLIIDMPCKHYDPETRLCLIHEGERPDICKDYLCEKARGDDGHS